MSSRPFDGSPRQAGAAWTPAPLSRRLAAWTVDMSFVSIATVLGLLCVSAGRSTHSSVATLVGAAYLAGGAWYLLTKDGGPGGASLGKRWNEIAVLHRDTWRPCTRSRSALRALVRLVPGFVPVIEGGAILVSPLRLSLADRLARTQVVEAPPPLPRAPGAKRWSWRGALAGAAICGAALCFVWAVADGFTRQARRMQAQTDLHTIENCLDLYRVWRGRYPTMAEGLAAVVEAGKCKRRLVDPWGRAYDYVCPGRERAGTCEVRSYGADGKPGGADDDEDLFRRVEVDEVPPSR